MDTSNRTIYEEHIRQWIDGTKPLSQFECSLPAEVNEGVRATDAALKNVLWDILEKFGEDESPPSKTGGKTEKMECVDQLASTTTEAVVLSRFVDVMVYLCEKEMASPNLPG